jgi:predicted hotdog family 3-hydroxylacyl-ACP dehydratase
MSFGMTDKELRQINVLELLPQRPPFIMIDCLAHFNEKVTETEFEVRGDNLFYEDGQLSASALTENIAQTCAARLGYINKYILHCSVQLGFRRIQLASANLRSFFVNDFIWSEEI